MKVENGEKSMKTTILWKSALVVSALLVFLFAILGEAAPMGEAGPQVATPSSEVITQPSQVATPPLQVTMRPLSDFLDAQEGRPPKFFPPVANYVGWTDGTPDNPPDNPFTIFALIDYAGIADRYLRGQLGTKVVNGSVTESELADGRAKIEVTFTTTNALGFAQSFADLKSHNFKFKNTPTIFGNTAKDVHQGAEAAVGESTLFATFSISEPGGALPDLIDVLVNNTDAFQPVDVSFIARIPGTCENGTRAVLHVDQAGPPGCKPSPSPVCRNIVEILHESCN